MKHPTYLKLYCLKYKYMQVSKQKFNWMIKTKAISLHKYLQRENFR